MSSFNESVGLGYLKTNAIEFVKYPSHSFMPVLQDCMLYITVNSMAYAEEVVLTYSLLKVTVIYKQSYRKKYWHLVYSCAATDLKCWYTLWTLGGTRNKMTWGSVFNVHQPFYEILIKNVHARCCALHCLLAGPKNGCIYLKITFLQTELLSYSLPVRLLCEWDYYF